MIFLNFPQIRIEQQHALIGLDIKKPDLKTIQGKPLLQIKREMGKLDIETDHVEINVDNYPSYYDLGYRKPADISKDIAGKGREVYLEYVKRTSINGDRLMRIEENTTISDIAVDETFSGEKEVNLAWIRGPEIDVIKAELSMEYTPGRIIFYSQLAQTRVDLDWGKVNVYLKQYPHIDIQVIGGELNITG
ncbi:MAG: hypothetical protein GX175_04840 [Halanaerobiaceae bacterium]|nr:hypothetical protein [Halanaerobiaceae bacterium]